MQMNWTCRLIPVYWDRLIDLIGDMADYAEHAGNRLRLLIAR